MSAPSRPRARRLGAAATLTAVSTATLVVAGAPAIADQSATPLTGAQLAAVDQLTATGLDRVEATRRVLAQDDQTEVADRLTARLSSRAVGAYIDQGSGGLVVNLTDRAAESEVRRAGAKARTVQRGMDELRRAKAALDRAGERATAAASWYIDIPSNQVVLQVPESHGGVTDLLRTAERLGDAVRVESSAGTPTTQSGDLYGGQQIEFTSNGHSYVCSVGFNATDSAGNEVMVTAGHCAEGVSRFTRNGTHLGDVKDYSFPGNDYAYSTLDTDNWNPKAAVWRYNGTAVSVSGHSKASVGSTVCKSGRTTNWTCGEIKAHDVTVRYKMPDNSFVTVSGLTQHDACSEGGDSGGSAIAGTSAQGVNSGGQGYEVDTNGDGKPDKAVCGEKVGEPNVSYYQPIGEVLSAYNLTLTTS
ncbi:serine protease [Longimycelium tulufanense]|uniref:Serine protease n=1 Tax=Longimycelium tulufanense TaxID=907463 RepID=A0A8J3C921_9PSEU|nr:S1 family peptidase [Longimycelium tulufanense]GGM57914.1 serine protease [Longimycelium tulufanense]